MTFREALNVKWFEVVDGATIIFCGPLQACGEALENDDNADNLIIRPISF